ncbi:phage holin [Priestia endophytica]|uniref:phage holin n=1 Tax=Priestia endophytica TaxID=135735 RepID=UPI0022820FCE|nr:phage holin [Priestia endophytica]MCY8234815.1 phage holin [Priestia endophytica]
MKKIDKGTLIRSVLLFVALINQTLIMMGKPVIPVEEGQITSFVDGIYLVGSIALTIVTSIAAWWKNNFITKKGKAQKVALREKKLL